MRRRIIILGLALLAAAAIAGGLLARSRQIVSAYRDNQIQVGDVNDDGVINFPGDAILVAKMSFGLAPTPVPYEIPNLVPNGSFDADIGGWVVPTLVPPVPGYGSDSAIQWDDAKGNPPGSIHIANPGHDLLAGSACVQVSPGSLYRLSTDLFLSPTFDVGGIGIGEFLDPDCAQLIGETLPVFLGGNVPGSIVCNNTNSCSPAAAPGTWQHASYLVTPSSYFVRLLVAGTANVAPSSLNADNVTLELIFTPPMTTATPTPTATATPHPCTGASANAVWSAGNGHCYQRFDDARNFARARYDCQLRGDHLVTMSDQDEQDFVVSNVGGGDTFIGITDELVEGDFRWVTGEPVLFTAWNSGEPNNGAGGSFEDAAILNPAFAGGRWNDAGVTVMTGYICESPY